MSRRIVDDRERADPSTAFPGVTPDAVMAWLREKTGESAPECQVCSRTVWAMGDFVARLYGDRFPAETAAYPVVPIICKHCGNTLLLNALVIGAFGSNGEEADE